MTLDWEFLIRIAFGFKENKGREIRMGGDPAGMANNEYFNDRHFNDIVITTGYAMQILNQDVKNRKVAVPNDTITMLDSFIVQILNSITIGDIENIIDSYKTLVFERFFKYDGTVLSRK
ncbi:MAG: hypothetical protein HZB41_03375 [Ignavibacteriae bacterium]|nr:hypothetical protein [Ignavibacteriota bacterium]